MATVFAPPVPDTVLQFAALKTDYLGLASTSLGDTATPGDGFDAAFSATAAGSPQTDSGFAASDAAFAALVDALAGFWDDGLDTLASELGERGAALSTPEGAFQSAVAGLGSPLQLPATPSTVSIPNFNVSTGIPAPPSLPNPPVSGQKPGSGGGVPAPPPVLPPQGEPLPGQCQPGDPMSQQFGPNVNDIQCTDIFYMPTQCPCGCDPFLDPNCLGPNLAELE